MSRFRVRLVIERRDLMGKKRWRLVHGQTASTSENRGNADMAFNEIVADVGGELPPWTPFEEAESERPRERVYVNSRFQVHITPRASDEMGRFNHVSFKSIDRTARHDWRDIQRMKNELLGEDVEALEVYPAEDRLHDTCNQFHIYAFEPGRTIPLGWTGRVVGETPHGEVGSQRPFDDDNRPPDLKTKDEIDALDPYAPTVGHEYELSPEAEDEENDDAHGSTEEG